MIDWDQWGISGCNYEWNKCLQMIRSHVITFCLILLGSLCHCMGKHKFVWLYKPSCLRQSEPSVVADTSRPGRNAQSDWNARWMPCRFRYEDYVCLQWSLPVIWCNFIFFKAAPTDQQSSCRRIWAFSLAPFWISCHWQIKRCDWVVICSPFASIYGV